MQFYGNCPYEMLKGMRFWIECICTRHKCTGKCAHRDERPETV